jgi:hypothetical protein
VGVTDNEKHSSLLWYGIIYSSKGFTEQTQRALGSFGGIFKATINRELLDPNIFVNFSHFQQSQIFVGKAGWNLPKWEYIEVLQSSGRLLILLINIRLGWKLLTVIHALAYCDSDLIKPLKISVVKVPDGFRKFRNFITFLRRRKSGTKF